jgi:hypothetical protein
MCIIHVTNLKGRVRAMAVIKVFWRRSHLADERKGIFLGVDSGAFVYREGELYHYLSMCNVDEITVEWPNVEDPQDT